MIAKGGKGMSLPTAASPSGSTSHRNERHEDGDRKMLKLKAVMITTVLGAMLTVSACSQQQVVDNTASTTGFVAKTAVKGVYGAGKLAVKGVKKVAAN